MNKKLIVITGASSGIGAALAKQLCTRKNISLILCGQDKKRLEEVKNYCISCQVETISLVGNISNISFRKKLLDEIVDNGNIYALVNSAGLGIFGSPLDVTDEEWMRVIDTNLNSTFFLCRDIGNLMSKNKQGIIVNISSDADTIGFPDATTYCASKGGVLLMSRAMRLSLQPYGIKVTTLSPGRVDTRFNNKEEGMRPGALLAKEVAECIEFIIYSSNNIEISEMRIDSMDRGN